MRLGTLAMWTLALVLLPAAARAQERRPVVAYDFSGRLAGLVRDASGNGRHGTIRGASRYTDGPTGPAMVFDGRTCIEIAEDKGLDMANALTVDIWARNDGSDDGTLCDRISHRYRVAALADGRVHFGLKSPASRGDLMAGEFKEGEWRRITAVFERPTMTLYIDGEAVGSRPFDEDIGPGTASCIGAYAGTDRFFAGAIDQIRIYDYARPPRPGDEELSFIDPQFREARLDMGEEGGVATVDTGAMRFEIDRRSGAVRSVEVDGKRLVADNGEPMVFATIMESAEYDGLSDFVARRMVEGRHILRSAEAFAEGDGFAAEIQGTLDFSQGDAIDYSLRLGAARGERRLRATLALEKRGEFKDRFVRAVGLRQPLALNHRKRVVQASDQGMRWDTRYRYEFHMHTTVGDPPDRNWWRHFYIDQDSGHSYSLWRAESVGTAGLSAFRGRRAPGWMTLYDEQGGVLAGYRGFADRAPKCLYANAEAGGEAVVYLYSPTRPAFDIADARLADAVFGKPHEIDMVFFKGEEAFEQPERKLAQAWGVDSLASDGPPRMRPVADEVDLWTAPPAEGSAAPLVMGGLPLPRGAIANADQARLFVRGKESPLQSEALAYWPDGTVKWALLVFPLDGDGGYDFTPGSGDGDEVKFDVTLRQGEPVPCALRFGQSVSNGLVSDALAVRHTEEMVAVDTGPLALTLATGEEWLASAALEGREMLRPDGAPQAFVDFLRTDSVYPVGTTHPEGTADPGPVRIDRIDVEEKGALRTVVRLEGRAMAREPARIVMRIEAYAGRPYVRLHHSVEFLHDDPRQAFVRRMGLRLPLALDRGGRTAAGAQDGPRALEPAQATGLRQTSFLNYELWQKAPGGRHREIRDTAHCSRGWLGMADARSGVAVAVRDMWQDFPKEIVADRNAPALEVGLWPESSPLMDVRRYSNYPHRAQGESTGWNLDWVLESYYPQDPFVGVTKSHEMLLYFYSADTPLEQMDAVAADFQSRPLAYPGWEWYAKTGITMPLANLDSGKFDRFKKNMATVADWWLFHQKAYGWYGMWDYGDVQHRYRAGYGRIFKPEDLAKLLAMPTEERNRAFRDFEHRQDYFTQNDWAFDNGRWGWGNTEGLPNYSISLMYLATGRRDLFFFTEANARHVRDVDARHAGRWFGRGTRHGVQHWSDGNHEERQTTFTEQRFHYLLTGEHRTREWNRDLADGYYLQGVCGRHAAHSGRTYGLLFRWELTADPDLAETMNNYMRALSAPEGIAIDSDVRFPAGERIGPPQDINGGSMFFHVFGAMHAMIEYHHLTGDQVVRDSIIATADYALDNLGRGGDPGMYRKAVAFAARHAPDGEKYRKAIRDWAGGPGYGYVFQQVPANPEHWHGQTSFLRGNVSGGLFWLQDAAYVLGCLDQEPQLSDRQLQDMRQTEERPVVDRPRRPRESWQSEFDLPEFEAYLEDPMLERLPK